MERSAGIDEGRHVQGEFELSNLNLKVGTGIKKAG